MSQPGNKKALRNIFLRAFEDVEHPGGDSAGTRTQGPYIKSVLLYQLSYRIDPPVSQNFDEQSFFD